MATVHDPVYCPHCGNRVAVKMVPDDGSNIFTRFFGSDGWHREFRCPACQWTGRTPNYRDLNKRIPVVGGEVYKKKKRIVKKSYQNPSQRNPNTTTTRRRRSNRGRGKLHKKHRS